MVFADVYLIFIVGNVFLPLIVGLAENGFILSDSFGVEITVLVVAVISASDTGITRHVSRKISAKRISQISAFFGGLFALCVVIIFQIPETWA